MKKILTSLALTGLLFTGVTAVTATPAEARASIGFYFGDGGYYGPPGGHYRRHYEPVYYNGYWYRDAYYRDYGPRRAYWIDNDWRYDGWRGPRPRHIRWERHHRHHGWR